MNFFSVQLEKHFCTNNYEPQFSREFLQIENVLFVASSTQLLCHKVKSRQITSTCTGSASQNIKLAFQKSSFENKFLSHQPPDSVRLLMTYCLRKSDLTVFD